jgi:hypothetical protein
MTRVSRVSVVLALCCLLTISGVGSAIAQSDVGGDESRSGSRATVLTTVDGVVQPSLCVGTGCSASESFGFDVIKLKENNTQLVFEDTSASPDFPSNDWRLVANESTTGGANQFSIQDAGVDGSQRNDAFIIEAGAPDNAMVLDDRAFLGLGRPTSAGGPALHLHIQDGNTPAVRLQQDNSDGFTPQIFDIAANEANFFIRDVSNGSALPFRIVPGAPGNAIYVASSGNVGLGTAAPQARLHVEGDVRVDGAVFQLSSRSAKTDFEPMAPARLLRGLQSLELGLWRYRKGEDRTPHFGPAAEDFHAAFGLGGDGKRVSLADMAGIALGAAQALKEELDERDRKIESLEARITRLERALLESQGDGGI